MRRYVITLGHSMTQSNGAFFKEAGIEMILLTFSDVEFSPASSKALEAVGWKFRQVS